MPKIVSAVTKFGLKSSVYWLNSAKYCQWLWYFDYLNQKKQKTKAFDLAYPDASFSIVDRDNYLDFICS